jgi:CHAT domain-containing protein
LGLKPDEAITLHNIGYNYSRIGDRERAIQYLDQAIKIKEVLGEKKSLANSLGTLGSLLVGYGQKSKAMNLFDRSINIRREIRDKFGEAEDLESKARLMHNLGRASECASIFQEITLLQSQLRDTAFQSLSETEKSKFSNTFRSTQAMFITHIATNQVSKNVDRQSCFDAWLDYKGAVLGAQGRLLDTISKSDDIRVREKAKALKDTRIQLSRLFRKSIPQALDNTDQSKMANLEKIKNDLEGDLAKLNRAFAVGQEASRITSTKLAKLLPENSVYIDYAHIRRFDFSTGELGESHYFVFCIASEHPESIVIIDLGEAELIDKVVTEFLNSPLERKFRGRKLDSLYTVLLQPFEFFLKGHQKILISPDGPLNLVPFEILGPESGDSLMSRFTVSYLNAGQDVVRFSIPRSSSRKVVLFGNPEFDLGDLLQIDEKKRNSVVSRSSDLPLLHFSKLPGTQAEADSIARLFPVEDVQLFTGEEALEERLTSQVSPRYLHLATHGFFLGHQNFIKSGLPATNLPKPGVLGNRPTPVRSIPENPMPRSGLALAKANTSIRLGGDDGIVCAEKLLGLNLFGTDLVVLSACNTGIGKVQDGEGVFGLKRAFLMSGAKSLVVSLWQVPDEETKDLMTIFYLGLIKGKSKATALADAKMDVASRNPNPFYWAAFVLIGNPD